MKSILIVTEQFTAGGLETHIRGEILRLTEKGVKVHLAAGAAFNDALLPDVLASLSHGIPLEPTITPNELLVAIDRLREIIRSKSIDCVHVHPFSSIIPAVAAAELEAIPVVITIHGPASLMSYGALYDFLIKHVILPKSSLVVAVSPEAKNLISVYAGDNNVVCIPNAVPFPALEDSISDSDSNQIGLHWLVVSRLDQFKIHGIIDFCVKAKSAGISGVRIVGDGPAKEELIIDLERRGLSGYVTLLGASAQVESLIRLSAGVAGMGRVVLEGLSLKKPVVLVGYDGVKGVVDKALLQQAATNNFSGRGLCTISLDDLCEQLERISHVENMRNYDFAKSLFNDNDAWTIFLNKIVVAEGAKPSVLSGLYESISRSPVKESGPYLYSIDVMDRLGELILSHAFYEPKLAVAISFCRYRMNIGENTLMGNELIVDLYRELAERSSELACLHQELAERGSELSRLHQKLAERESESIRNHQELSKRETQLVSLNHKLKDRDDQINDARLYINDKEVYIAMLKIDIEKLTSKGGRMGAAYRNIKNYTEQALTIFRSRGLKGLIDAVILKLRGNNVEAVQNSAHHVSYSPRSSESRNLEDDQFAGRQDSLLDGELVVIAGIPFDDVGGGQRAAQLARCALKTGRKVVYLYIYKKFDFEQNRHVDSNVIRHGLIHEHIDSISPKMLLSLVSSRATLLIELPHRTALPYLHLFKSRGMRTVFELIDDWETSLGGDWFDMDIYRNFVLESDCVVGTAKILVKRLQYLGREDALYLPNAANEYIFDKYKNFSRPGDLPVGYRRIGLYFGSLYGEWFAWDYIERAASMNRDTAFVLIGDKPNRSAIPVLPKNVYLLGGKLIDELPAYLVHSDFSLLPFVPGKISDAVSPIKVFEYLFSGSPVVATNLPEILDYPGVLVADTQEEFAQLCNKATRTNESESENDRFIYTNSWFYRLDVITRKDEFGKFEGILSVVILIHNNKSIIGRCLDSLLMHGDRYLKEVIVVDNASIDGGAEYVEVNFPAVKVIRNAMNGCSSGRNLGAQAATGKFLAFFDSDQWFTSRAGFEEALTILERDANVGVVGWGAGWFDASRSDLGGMIADYCQDRAMNDVAMKKGYRSDIGYLGTCGFFLPKVVFDATQGFDVAYDPTCFEDTDMSFQIKQLGLDICYRDLTGIRHQPHQTTKASDASDTYTKLFSRNAEYFKKKWSNYPHFFLDYSR